MLPRARRTSAALMVVIALVAALVATGTAPAAQAADDKGLANGAIRFPQHDRPGIRMLWFDRNWNYLGQKSASGGGYSIWLEPGTYHLQFVDQRPSYRVEKYAPTDIQVTVHARDITTRNVTMRRGAAITGTARAGGKPLSGATIYAANTDERSYPTVANKKGQFAVGGLPQGRYCLFTYDKAKRYVDKCTWAGAVKPGQVKDQPVVLRKKAGNLTVYLFTPGGRMRARSAVTVTSNQTGQWWTATARDGTAVFKGLHPGSYTLKFNGAGVWLPQTGAVQRASVRSGAMAFGKFQVTRHGGWIDGTVVDSADPSRTLAGATVQLWDAQGHKLDETTSGADGQFMLDGQLATQSGLTLVLQPGPYSDYLGEEPLRCQYVRTELGGFSVETGRETFAGDVGIDRKSPQTKTGCEA